MQNTYYGSGQGSIGGMTYDVDMVFCIDATESMDPFLDMVKENALNFYDDLVKSMQEKNKRLDSVRIRIVAFRDYLADGDQAMLETGFFSMPGQREDFRDCVSSIEAKGGGDDPEDAFEAIAYAIKSSWTPRVEGKKRRQIVIVWTDAEPHPVRYGARSPHYPNNMAADFNELTAWWENMDRQAKRLLLFTPATGLWNNIINNWDNVVHSEMETANGLDNLAYGEMLNLITQSI